MAKANKMLSGPDEESQTGSHAALRGRRLVRWLQRQHRAWPGTDESEAWTTPICLADVMLAETTTKQSNPFVVLLIIHLKPERTLEEDDKSAATTSRRVLLDTGADFNLMSHAANLELNFTQQPCHSQVHSIGGYTDLKSTIVLHWHFQSHGAKSADFLSPHHAVFHLLPQKSETGFDCILGRPWIEQHWAEFIALVEIGRRKETSD